MVRSVENQYLPDSVTPPGESLLETLDALGMSQADLSDRTGRSRKMINEIIKGKAPVTPKMSLELERVLGVPASFWNNRERHYRESLARIEEQDRLKKQVQWLDRLPVKAMADWGWIRKHKEKVSQLQEVLRFFGIASPDQWPRVTETLCRQVAFRKSQAFAADNGALLAWLRKGEMDAKNIECKPFDEKMFRKQLDTIRRLTTEPPEVFQPELTKQCALCGVAVVFVPELPKSRVSGATRWLTSDKALIQLSLRYKSNDHLWFSFFHEAGHIIKHGKKEIFIESTVMGMDERKEKEADRFAADFLIPRPLYTRLIKHGSISKATIQKFASELGIAPGLVVGRLQHDQYLPNNHCNDLKIKLEWGQS